ncbi:hypothetical protein LJC23_07560, partial [Desulfovibrio sp. OttesenSCG-928-I05]|nr:hypothetical protein [Desulfovibrio sp. OttesenSCG-928-I05]
MRKIQQKKILDWIKSLNSSFAPVADYVSLNQATATFPILANVQKTAKEIEIFVESIAGKKTDTALLLKGIRKQIRILEHEIKKESANILSVNTVFEQLETLETIFLQEFRLTRMEVVFFPYKASMWDAFESVWRAATDDPDCDVYVVPIPYCDKKQDKSIGEIHYEGNEYPDYVTITDWREYSVDENRPDIIFIHSPYDASNYVTTVHPDYYSERLRDFTDLLVYIPYFVHLDTPQEKIHILPGVVYADMVVVQSESIRQQYLQEFAKIEDDRKRNGLTRKPEEIVVALGSPKFDKALASRHEEYALP